MGLLEACDSRRTGFLSFICQSISFIDCWRWEEILYKEIFHRYNRNTSGITNQPVIKEKNFFLLCFYCFLFLIVMVKTLLDHLFISDNYLIFFNFFVAFMMSMFHFLLDHCLSMGAAPPPPGGILRMLGGLEAILLKGRHLQVNTKISLQEENLWFATIVRY